MPVATRNRTNIKELVAALPVAADDAGVRLGCSGCSVSAYETIEAAPAQYGLRVEPIIAAPTRWQFGQRAADRRSRPCRRTAPAALPGARRSHVILIMSGKGGVGKPSLPRCAPSACAAANFRWDSTPISPGRRYPSSSDCTSQRSAPIRQDDAAGSAAAAHYAGDFAHAIEIVSLNLLSPEEDTAMVWGADRRRVIRQFHEQVPGRSRFC